MLEQVASPSIANTNWQKRLMFWAALTAFIFLFAWYANEVLLLTFAGALLAILLHTCAEWVERHTPENFGPKLSYAATVIGIMVIACALGFLIVPRAISEISQISKIIPKSLQQITSDLDQSDWGRYVVRMAHQSMSPSDGTARVKTATNDLAKMVEAAVVIFVVGFYGALNSRQYTKGLLRLIPEDKRQRTADVAGRVIYTLRWWLIGQLIPMVVLGAATMLGLWILGVPLAFALGLFTAVMIFIPYVGSWIAFVPTVLVSLTKSPTTALYVTMLYLVVHLIEGYILTPLVQKRAVLLPPVMTILAQLLMWKLTGLLGVAVATPLAAVGLTLMKVLYLHDPVEKR